MTERAWANARRAAFERGARQARLLFDLFPGLVARTAAANSSKPCVCSAMNAASSTRAAPAAAPASSASINALHRPGQRGQVAAVLHLRYWVLISVSAGVSISVGDCGLTKLHQAALAQRIEGDDGHAARRASCSWCSMRGLLTPTFWPKKKMQSVCSKSSRRARCRPARRCVFGQRHRGAFVAHVGAVRQVVVAVQPGQQLVHVAGLQRGAARGVEHHLFGSRAQGAQLGADVGEGLLPDTSR
jgi:hypothetical protein